MADTTQELTIDIKAKNQIFSELGNNNYNLIELIGELIDNSIVGRTTAQLQGKDALTIDLKIIKSGEQKPMFVIRDNACGISLEALPTAITPSGTAGGKGINEHGFGMKQAVSALGTLNYLRTKVAEQPAYQLSAFQFGKIPVVQMNDYAKDAHFTEISIKNANPILKTNARDITKQVIPWLGAKYRRYLTGDQPIQLNVTLTHLNKTTGQEKVIATWAVQAVKIHYYNPKTKRDEPIVSKVPFKGKGWAAMLTMGYAPTDEQYQALGLEKPKIYEPYNVSQTKQGLDILKDDRVINFTQLAEIGLVPKAHPRYNYIRGEIELLEGFPTSTAKNFIMRQEHWLRMIEQIHDYIDEKHLLNPDYDDSNPDTMSAEDYRDCFARYLRLNTKQVSTEVPIPGLNENIDIVSNTTAWSIVKQKANGMDVFKLFAYLTMSNGKYQAGKLLAPSFASSAQVAVKHLIHEYHVNIQLENMGNYHEPLLQIERQQSQLTGIHSQHSARRRQHISASSEEFVKKF